MPTDDASIEIDALRPADLPVAFGPFELTRSLGIGGMARVFKAEQPHAPAIAIKILRDGRSKQSQKLARALRNEALFGSALDHPNLVRTLDVGDINGRPYIALEYVDGLTLADFLSQGGRPSVDLCVELGVQMSRGLHAAHSATLVGEPLGLVHRDLKPSNVMLNRAGVVKIMDFGIAKARQHVFGGTTTETGRVKGTPMYMSPEQARGKTLDGRSDLFAMGAILFEMLTGNRLFVGSSIAAVLMRILCVEALLTRDRNFLRLQVTHPRLADAVARCLRVDPNERFADAGELLAELERISLNLPMDESLATAVANIMDAEPVDERPTLRLEHTQRSGPIILRAVHTTCPDAATVEHPLTPLAGVARPASRAPRPLRLTADPFADPDLSFFGADPLQSPDEPMPIRLEKRLLASG